VNTDGDNTSTGKIEMQRLYDKTASVKIPKMKVTRELYSNTRTSPIYLVNYKSKNDDQNIGEGL